MLGFCRSGHMFNYGGKLSLIAGQHVTITINWDNIMSLFAETVLHVGQVPMLALDIDDFIAEL